MEENVDGQDIAKPVLKVPPPLIALTLVGAGLGVHFDFPAWILPAGWIQFTVGLPVLAIGVFLLAASLRTLGRADTDDSIARPTSVIVEHGPYRLSRNPVYVGIAFAVNALWMFGVLPLPILYFQFGVILREERYLERRFGEGHLGYKSLVICWI